MARVLTTASVVLCGPDTGSNHGGRVSTTSAAKLSVNGARVLLRSGIGPTLVSLCKTPSSPSTKPCTSVSIIQGDSTKLRAGGAPVMLDILAGTTDGVPPGTVPASAEQAKLTAV